MHPDEKKRLTKAAVSNEIPLCEECGCPGNSECGGDSPTTDDMGCALYECGVCPCCRLWGANQSPWALGIPDPNQGEMFKIAGGDK